MILSKCRLTVTAFVVCVGSSCYSVSVSAEILSPSLQEGFSAAHPHNTRLQAKKAPLDQLSFIRTMKQAVKEEYAIRNAHLKEERMRLMQSLGTPVTRYKMRRTIENRLAVLQEKEQAALAKWDAVERRVTLAMTQNTQRPVVARHEGNRFSSYNKTTVANTALHLAHNESAHAPLHVSADSLVMP